MPASREVITEMIETGTLLSIKEASIWATEFTGKSVTPSNIAYLINYGRITKIGENGNVLVAKQDLINYYEGFRREQSWKKQLGDDLNWALSFEQYKESETTKHVHRLHPYKGKFIPQLVEYFLDTHTDKFKKESFFQAGDIVLDPFCGSGTTLVQASELGIHAIGIDISAFNALISNVKVQKINFDDLHLRINEIVSALRKFVTAERHVEFENKLAEFLNNYNNQFFPSPEFKIKARRKDIDETKYAAQHEAIVLKEFNRLVKESAIEIKQQSQQRFIEKWFLQSVRDEIDFVFDQIKKVENPNTKKILTIILSRTIRSCRATTHADLATLLEPVATTYYCAKHGKICKPLFSIASWWERYCTDTVKHLRKFSELGTNAFQVCWN